MMRLLAFLFVLLMVAVPAYAQRNASFLNPNTASANSSSGGKGGGTIANTVVADPPQIDAGETLVNVARRVTVFFLNGFRGPVQMNELTLNADGNVRSKVVNDDCNTLKTLPVGDKCSIALEVVPTSPGPWSVELLLNHSGTGRIARAEVTGSTLGKADEKSEGLAISKKIAAPLDFGDMRVHEEKAARTMLIENDSNDVLHINEIDLIAAEGEGLSLRNTGCKKEEALKPGESCPITVMWEPSSRGTISTDLIVHHSGNLGFVVVPIRGKAISDEGKIAAGDDKKSGSGAVMSSSSTLTKNRIASEMPVPERLTPLPQPTTEQIAASLPPVVSSSILPQRKSAPKEQPKAAPKDALEQKSEEPITLSLIGTVGGRAILGDESDETHMIGLGEKIAINGQDVELLQLDPTRAIVMVAGKRVPLSLRSAPSYMQKEISSSGDKTGSHSESPVPAAMPPASSSSKAAPVGDAPVSDAAKTSNQGASLAPLSGAAAAALAN